MLIDGRQIAQELKFSLKLKVSRLIKNGINPHLAILYVGNDPGSFSYVNAKRRFGAEIGVKVIIYPSQSDQIFASNNSKLQREEILTLIRNLNTDKSVHGIIVQRPLPIPIEKSELDLLVSPRKDVDGFHPQTQFNPPVALAVDKILKWVAHDLCTNPDSPLKHTPCDHYLNWLKKQKILVIGRGETAGKPIAKYLLKKDAQVTIAHSKTENLTELCLMSDIIISCVGKSSRNKVKNRSILRSTESSRNNGSVIVRRSMINNKTILVGVGLHSEDGILRADYDPAEIKDTAAYYTPVPGGVGPVNVACLMENVISAATA